MKGETKVKGIQGYVEDYRQFCRDNVYVCAYCDHCLEEDEIVRFFEKALHSYAQEQVKEFSDKVQSALLQDEKSHYDVAEMIEALTSNKE